MPLNLQHQTAAQFAERFWNRVYEAQKQKNKLELHRLVFKLWTMISAGDLTSAQVRDSYNAWRTKRGLPTLTSAEWTTLVTGRLTTMKDRYIAMRDEVAL